MRRTPSMSSRRGCALRWAKVSSSRREAATPSVCRRARSTPTASRSLAAWAGRACSRPAAGGGGDVATRAWALARPGAGRRPRRGLRPAGDRAARRPAPHLPRRARRCRPRLGRHAEVLGELEALVREHPFRERLHGQLMLSLYRAGRQADALAAYRAARRALVDGLGIEPSRELRELEVAILRQDVPRRHRRRSGQPVTRLVRPDTRRRVTCVFSQLADPDEVAALDPEALRAVLERYHDTARAVCARHGGVMAELRGEAVLAVFGIPVAHEDDARRALRAAAEMGARTEQLPFGLCARQACARVTWSRPWQDSRSGRWSARPSPGPNGSPGWPRVVKSGSPSRPGTWCRTPHTPPSFPAAASCCGTSTTTPQRSRAASTGRSSGAKRRSAGSGKRSRASSPGARRSSSRSSASPASGSPAWSPSCRRSPASTAVLTGRCPAYGEGVTYWPLREIVGQAARGRSVDELAATLGIPPSVAHRVAGSVGIEEGEAAEEPAGRSRG